MIKDGLVDIDDISVLKEAEKCASRLCCTDCKALICEEKCECWNFAKKGVEYGYIKGIKTKVNTTTISDCPIKDEFKPIF